MSYKVTITNNETGAVLLNEENAIAEDVISQLRIEPTVDLLLRLKAIEDKTKANDIDEVVYRKNNEDKIKKYEIKKGLECCAAVGSETSCSDCSYTYKCRDLCKDALDLITEQEKEIDALKEKCELLKEYEK